MVLADLAEIDIEMTNAQTGLKDSVNTSIQLLMHEVDIEKDKKYEKERKNEQNRRTAFYRSQKRDTTSSSVPSSAFSSASTANIIPVAHSSNQSLDSIISTMGVTDLHSGTSGPESGISGPESVPLRVHTPEQEMSLQQAQSLPQRHPQQHIQHTQHHSHNQQHTQQQQQQQQQRQSGSPQNSISNSCFMEQHGLMMPSASNQFIAPGSSLTHLHTHPPSHSHPSSHPHSQPHPRPLSPVPTHTHILPLIPTRTSTIAATAPTAPTAGTLTPPILTLVGVTDTNTQSLSQFSSTSAALDDDHPRPQRYTENEFNKDFPNFKDLGSSSTADSWICRDDLSIPKKDPGYYSSSELLARYPML